MRAVGFKELNFALGELPKATAKGVLVRVMKKAGAPIAEHAASLVHVDKGDLKGSAGVGTKLTTRQARLHKKSSSRSFAEVFVGFGRLTQAVTEEFGTPEIHMNPALRPAWDAGKRDVVESIKKDTGAEIIATAKRSAKRKAAKAARGK
jgi:hypothetical protein